MYVTRRSIVDDTDALKDSSTCAAICQTVIIVIVPEDIAPHVTAVRASITLSRSRSIRSFKLFSSASGPTGTVCPFLESIVEYEAVHSGKRGTLSANGLLFIPPADDTLVIRGLYLNILIRDNASPLRDGEGRLDR